MSESDLDPEDELLIEGRPPSPDNDGSESPEDDNPEEDREKQSESGSQEL